MLWHSSQSVYPVYSICTRYLFKIALNLFALNSTCLYNHPFFPFTLAKALPIRISLTFYPKFPNNVVSKWLMLNVKLISLSWSDVTCRCWRISRPDIFTSHGMRRSAYSTRLNASSAKSTRCQWWTTTRIRALTSSGWSKCISSWINIAVTVSNNWLFTLLVVS